MRTLLVQLERAVEAGDDQSLSCVVDVGLTTLLEKVRSNYGAQSTLESSKLYVHTLDLPMIAYDILS